MSLTTTSPAAVRLRDLDGDLTVGGRRMQGVRDEVGDDLQDPVAVADDDRLRLGIDMQLEVPAAGLLALGAGRALADVEQVDLLDVERELARLETREVEQVADQALQAAGLGEHDVERRLLLLLALDDTVRDRLHVALDGGERRAQLVRDAHQEVALVLARLLQLPRHLLEAQRQLPELVGALRLRGARRNRRARSARSRRSAPAPGA